MWILTKDMFFPNRRQSFYRIVFLTILFLLLFYFNSLFNLNTISSNAYFLPRLKHSVIILKESQNHESNGFSSNAFDMNNTPEFDLNSTSKRQETVYSINLFESNRSINPMESNSGMLEFDIAELNLPPLITSDLYPESYQDERTKYLIPFMAHFVGAGNQLIEFITAAVLARALNRTLCASPFQFGPRQHGYFSSTASWGMAIEERYNLSFLKRYVNILSEENCMQVCDMEMDGFWKLHGNRSSLFRKWNAPTNASTLYLQNRNKRWKSVHDIVKVLGRRGERCAGLGSIFPGLRWQGAYASFYPFLKTSSPLLTASSFLSSSLHLPPRYLGVHWRFWEPVCKAEEHGLCFARCQNGAIQNQPHLIPHSNEWTSFQEKGCPNDGLRYRFVGVKLKKESLIRAIIDRLRRHGLSHVYLSTDAENRGEESCLLLSHVIKGLRDEGFHTVGMYNCPNFTSGVSSHAIPPPSVSKIFSKIKVVPHDKVSTHSLSLIEQEVLRRSEIFLGSGQSTWSLSVMEERKMRRMKKIMIQNINFSHATSNFHEEVDNWPDVKTVNSKVDDLIINSFLSFNHIASQSCEYKSSSNVKREKIMDDIEQAIAGEDGWLEYEACERRTEWGEECEIGMCWT